MTCLLAHIMDSDAKKKPKHCTEHFQAMWALPVPAPDNVKRTVVVIPTTRSKIEVL